MRLNCDLGEQEKLVPSSPEKSVMPYIDQANICCGAHAGNKDVMRETVILAIANKVEIGAHPSYPDRKNFGRLSLKIPQHELKEVIIQQIMALQKICEDLNTTITYVKPHGALYNDMMRDVEIRNTIMSVISSIKIPLKLMVMANNQQEMLKKEASAFNIDLLFEAFADRCYTDEGLLVSRDKSHAVHDRQKILEQVVQITTDKFVKTENGCDLLLNIDTICVHGDNLSGIAIIKDIQALINKA